MKHRMIGAALGLTALLAAGCADKQQIAELEASNTALRAEIEHLHVQLQSNAVDKARIEDLLKSRRTLQAEVQKLYLQNQALQASAAKPAKKAAAR